MVLGWFQDGLMVVLGWSYGCLRVGFGFRVWVALGCARA